MHVESKQQLISRLPDNARAYLNKISGDIVLKREPYYAKVRFEFTATDNTTNITYVCASGKKVTCFDYGKGGSLVNAGFSATGYATANEADTNLQTTGGKETNNSDMFAIEGVALMPTPKSDPILLKSLIAELYVSAGFGGNLLDYKFGNPLFLPGGGGLHGGGLSTLSLPGTQDIKQNIPTLSTSNGLPGAGDVWPLDDMIVWMPKPEADSQFTMQIECKRDVTVVAPVRAAQASPLIAAVAPPTTVGAEGTYVEFLVRLIGTQLGPRSRNR